MFNASVSQSYIVNPHNQDRGSPHPKSKLTKEHLGESVLSETALLQNKKGTKLYTDRFVHKGQTYFIRHMKQATMKDGWLTHPCLAITFKNDRTLEFDLGETEALEGVGGGAQAWIAAINSQMTLLTEETHKRLRAPASF